jgi:hypothetical protein
MCLLVLLLAAASLHAAEVRGRVLDGTTLEPLARVSVTAGAARAITDEQGRFSINTNAIDLIVTTVGYRTERVPATPETDLEILLFPQVLRRQDAVTVAAGPFGVEAPLAVGIEGNELKNLASVLADDPLRAAQTLPGAASNDDFTSQFSVRGAAFDRVGLYLDGILMHQPFHAVQGEAASGSLTLFNGDLLDSMNLFASAMPPRLADRTAGGLELRSRDGDPQRFHARAAIASSNAGGVLEGPWKHGSWIVAVRQSYIQYLIQSVSDDPSLAFGFTDGQGRFRFDPSPRHSLTAAMIAGRSSLNRDSFIPRSGINTLIFADYDFALASLAWRATPNPHWTVTNRAAFLRERYSNRNREDSPLAASGYGEWIWNADASRGVRGSGLLEFGSSIRRIRDDGYVYRYVLNPAAVRPLDRYRGAGLRSGAYAQASRAFVDGQLILSAGGRVDHSEVNGNAAVSPYASVAWQATASTRWQAAWSQAVQYPEMAVSFSLFGRSALRQERSTHLLLSLEQRLGARTRLRAEAYSRNDRDLLFRPLSEPRLEGGRVVNPSATAPWENSVRAWSRGFQVFLQQRVASGFTGWLAYAYGQTGAREGILAKRFPLDFDQRHSVQAYGSYRLRPTVNLSARYVYGSGMPVPGFFRGAINDLFLAPERNRFRLPAYQRADARVNKSWQKGPANLTLYFELVNLFNRDNWRAEDLTSYDPRTGLARVNFTRMFPILPVAGFLAEF